MAQQPPDKYPVGSIVNGHVWTGTEWAPAQVMPAEAPPAADKFAHPSGLMDGWPTWVKIVFLFATFTAVVVFDTVYGPQVYGQSILQTLFGR